MKKLKIKKVTVADLSSEELAHAKGGGLTFPCSNPYVACTVPADTEPPKQ